ncbi:small metal-binding protein SmbP [Methylomagnum ishizawai]|uniref:small metal-binding protein SmbP n=1 Tax=Methylomagnum ishizawai TaxID=1760988 RepID=UPI001C34392B|nr:small metal-binding protein SmbP [Methylomagnum ishizawai]BBL77023.1 hypothetical protein MishRS11D_41210 [Methylomagnum ishizawai]
MPRRTAAGLWAALAATTLAGIPPGLQASPAQAEATPEAGKQQHTQEALKHAKQAAKSGKKGDVSVIVQHAQLAKTEVEAALGQSPDNAHLKAALDSLNQAIRQGEYGGGEEARAAAHEAVTHLKAVQ